MTEEGICRVLLLQGKAGYTSDKSKDRASLTYMAVNKEGSWKSNVGQTDVNSVTWSVFPAKEIKEPTIVDPNRNILAILLARHLSKLLNPRSGHVQLAIDCEKALCFNPLQLLIDDHCLWLKTI
ncbi:hypothetical protein VNO80_00544 [Phaseolus coccineus]|uniref:MTHFR SAM-binding regulatory domain-containing protein n=1 Tax=Phaseolus coccineus TaxID=3886 RepID=A0AAN9P415_PHACN